MGYSHLALVGSATATSSSDLFTSDANQAQGVFGIRRRLFDFGRVDAQISVARGREAEALAAYRLAVLHAAEDVEISGFGEEFARRYAKQGHSLVLVARRPARQAQPNSFHPQRGAHHHG